MTQEEKQLLLKGLCASLPYGVICHTEKGDGHLCSINQTIFGTEYGININPLKRDYFNDSETEEQVIKPYLRPMSSMTEEERKELRNYENPVQRTDFFYSHHIDCRFMIEDGLALEAPEGLYYKAE